MTDYRLKTYRLQEGKQIGIICSIKRRTEVEQHESDNNNLGLWHRRCHCGGTLNSREWKTRHHNVGVENAGVEIAGIGKLWKANILTICC